MDPLSDIVSIASIIAFASKTVALINNTIEELGSRPATLLLLSSETSVLCSVFGYMERSFEAHGSTARVNADISLPILSCMEIFKRIGILADMQPKKSPLKKATLTVLWHNKMKEMTQLLNDLERQKTTLLLALQSLQSEESYLSDKRHSTALVELQKAVEELKLVAAPNSTFQPGQKRFDTIVGALPHADAESSPSNLSSSTSMVVESTTQSESIAQTHKPFDGWLSSFSNPSNSPTDDDASLEEFRSAKAVLQRLRNNISTLYQQKIRLLSERTLAMQSKGREFLRMAAFVSCSATWKSPDRQSVLRRPLRLKQMSAYTASYYDFLGQHRICGFQDFERTEDVFPPIVPFDEPLFPAITAGDSCYKIDSGLKINQHQRLIDYFNEFLRMNNPAELKAGPPLVDGDRIYINDPSRGCNINISFRRTLRIPEDGKTYPLPACFDRFKLLKVDDFADKLPIKMTKKGRMFFPMFQREALAVTFDATAPRHSKKGNTCVRESFAVKLYAGSINCISGKASSDSSANEQDYIVCPQQIRLDGFCTSIGEVKQFVAMPHGWGYSAEKQVTGSEVIAGLQLQIARRLSDDVEFDGPFNAQNTRTANKLDLFSSPEQLGIRPGQILRVRDLTTVAKLVTFDLFDIKLQAKRFPQLVEWSESKCRPRFVSDIIQRNSSESGNMRRFILRPITPLRIFINWDSMNIPRENAWEEFSPFFDLSGLKKYILGTMRAEQTSHKTGYLYFNNTAHRGYPKEYTPIGTLGLDDGEVRLEAGTVGTGGLVGYAPWGMDTPKSADVTTAGWEMCVGVGGNLKQHIYRTVDKHLWDWENACFLNLQLLNSVAFHLITGVSAWSPISFKQYVQKKTPFYSFIPGDAATLEREGINFRGIEEIQTSHGGSRIGLRINSKGSVGCANCEINLCDTLLVSCNHVWCSDCIRTEMFRSGKTTCLYCEVVSETVLQFSAPAERPQAEAPAVQSLLTSDSTNLQNEPVIEEVRSLLTKLRRVLPFRFKDTQFPISDESIQLIVDIADQIMREEGAEVEFNMIFTLVRGSTNAARTLIIKAMLKLTRKRQYMERLLTLVSSVEELGENGLKRILEGSEYRYYGCLCAILDWSVGLPLSFADLRVSAISLLSVESPDTLCYVIDYLKSSGKSLPKDYGIRIIDVVPMTRPNMIVATAHTLAEEGCDMNSLDDKGRNILFRPWHMNVFFALMDIGARADILDDAGNAPIHHAILEDNEYMLEALMGHPRGRQTANMYDGQGFTPYQLSLRSQGSKMERLQSMLLRYGADASL